MKMYVMRTAVVLMVGVLAATTAQPSKEVSAPDINPGCSTADDCSEPWLVHVAARGPNNTIHHLWGTHGGPSFLLAKTTPEAKLLVNWTMLQADKEHSVKFTSKPSHVFGLSFPYLILYNDTHDRGWLDRSEDATITLNMSDFTWTVVDSNHTNSTTGEGMASVTFNTTAFRGTPLPNDTNICIKMSGYGNEGRAWEVPKLLHTPSSAQMELILHRLILNVTEGDLWPTQADSETMGGFVNARWALQMIVVSSEQVKNGQVGKDMDIHFDQHTSLDDENTPGVFHLNEMKTRLSREDSKSGGGYLQWRPISYLSEAKGFDEATNPNVDPLANVDHPVPLPLRSSLAYAVLGEEMVQANLSIANTTVSFGQTGDKFYTNKNFTTWTLALGEGSPPVEGFSTLVIAIISLGICIPLVMFLVGGVFIAYRRHRQNSPRLIDD